MEDKIFCQNGSGGVLLNTDPILSPSLPPTHTTHTTNWTNFLSLPPPPLSLYLSRQHPADKWHLYTAHKLARRERWERHWFEDREWVQCKGLNLGETPLDCMEYRGELRMGDTKVESLFPSVIQIALIFNYQSFVQHEIGREREREREGGRESTSSICMSILFDHLNAGALSIWCGGGAVGASLSFNTHTQHICPLSLPFPLPLILNPSTLTETYNRSPIDFYDVFIDYCFFSIRLSFLVVPRVSWSVWWCGEQCLSTNCS